MSNLVKKTKLTELENKIPDISNLATNTELIEKKQTITQKLLILKINLIIIIMINILIL